MAFTPIPEGTEPWGDLANDAWTDQDTRITTLEDALIGPDYYYLVASASAPSGTRAKADYTCDGVADQVQIQSAVDAASANGGGIVQLSIGQFNISAPITLHPRVTLQGVHGDQIFNPDQLVNPSRLNVVAEFVGGAAIVMLGQTAGGYGDKSAEQRIYALTIDGANGPAAVHGIQASDYIHGVVLRDVCVKLMTGKGIYTFTENAAQPFSWTMQRVVVDNPTGNGIELINHSDFTGYDVISIGAGGDAWILSNMPNSRMVNCRAEWSEGDGYVITGNFGTGQGSGGMVMTNCSTDRNRENGFLINATGNAPLVFGDLMIRRDGRNGGAGGGDFSGFRVTGATAPIIVDNITVYPGIDDDGAGTNSPVNAYKVSGSTYVALNSGFLHGATNGYVDGGTNAVLRRGPNIGERTGTTAAPVDAFANPWAAAGNMDVTGYFVAAGSGQSNGSWNIFGGNANALNLGAGGGGIAIAEGANTRMGVATLVAGTVTVANTTVAANDRIFLTSQADGGTPGFQRVSARVNGTSFTITSSNAADTSTVAWVILRPA